jgi:uncharacterized RDD family membrane protein YckC
MLVRSPIVRGRAEELAAAGREAEARSRQRLEDAAGGILTAPEATRTLDRALTQSLPDESIEELARRLLASPAFERVLREAAESRVTRDLIDDAIRSDELQRVVEEVMSGPAVRGALQRQTRTLRDDVTDRLVAGTARADDAIERVARRIVRRRTRTAEEVSPFAGLASRGAAFLVDAAVANLLVLGAVALVGVVGALLGISLPRLVADVLAGAGWTIVVAGYCVLFWSTAGQTPGMRLLRLRVEGPDGRPPGVGRSLARFLATVLALAPFGLGFLPVLYDRRRRALQDLLARTIIRSG